jgi:hypothetical protein
MIDGALVPVRVDYDGDWDIPFKKREWCASGWSMRDWEMRP